MRCSLRPVIRLVACGFLAHAALGCLAQRDVPSRTKAPQPGCLQGFGALDGIGAGSVRNGQEAVANMDGC